MATASVLHAKTALLPSGWAQDIRVEIDAAEVEALVRRGYLEPKDREDQSAIEAAANAAISDLLGGFL